MGDDILEVVPLAEAESWGAESKKGGRNGCAKVWRLKDSGL